MPDELPEIRRTDYSAHVHDASPEDRDDPHYRGSVAAEAVRLDPLRQIQVAFDQTVVRAEALRRGEPWPYGFPFGEHAAATVKYAERRRDVLRAAASAAASMITEMHEQLTDLDTAMSKKKEQEKEPDFTTDGTPHPLQEGGYDPAKDAQLPPNVSDIATLNAGLTTHDQADAMAKADAARTEGQDATDAATGATAGAASDDEEDETDEAGKKTGKKKPKKAK